VGRREAVRVADPVPSGINLAMAVLAPVRDGVGPVVHLASAVTALLQESIARNEPAAVICEIADLLGQESRPAPPPRNRPGQLSRSPKARPAYCATWRPTCPCGRSPLSCACRRTPSGRTCGTCTGSSARTAATRPCNAPASPACSRRPTGGPRYRSEIRHDIRARERHLVLIVAVTWVDRVVQVLSGLRASNSPDGIPDALGSDNG
jgi:hypothetical protein